MKLPFTPEQFLDVFRKYNISVWPMQVILIILALVAIYFSIFKKSYSDKIIVFILAFLWGWMGIVYHLIYFSSINKAAIVFGFLFVLQGLLFLYFTIIKKKISFRFKVDVYGMLGSILILFALLIYPLIGYWSDHVYPSSPTFGSPCPTTIFTFGILLFSAQRIPVIIIVIPLLWSLIGFSAAFSLGIKEDISLLVSALLFAVLIINRNRKSRKPLSY